MPGRSRHSSISESINTILKCELINLFCFFLTGTVSSGDAEFVTIRTGTFETAGSVDTLGVATARARQSVTFVVI